MKDREQRSRWWGVVILVALVGMAGRWWQTGESLWVDELHTAWCVGGELAEVAPRAAMGNQSPLFFWLEWVVVRLLGPSEFSLRLMSVAAGSLLPLALFGLCWRWTGSAWVGFIAAVLVVVEPLSIFFATEARPYVLVQLLAVLHVWAFAEMLRQPTRWLRAAFVFGGAVLFYLHYTAGLLLVAEVVAWGVVISFQRDWVKYRWAWLAMDCGMIAVLCLPASGQLVEILQRRENWAGFIRQRPLWELFAVLPWSAAAVWVSGAMLLAAARDFSRANRVGEELRSARGTGEERYASGINPEARELTRSVQIVALCWLLVPLATAWVLTAADAARVLLPRYVAASAPAAMLLAAMCIDLVPWRWGKYAAGAALLVAAVASSGIREQWRIDGRLIDDRKEDWRGAVAWLTEQLAKEEIPVFVASGLIEADALSSSSDAALEDYCLLPVQSLYRLQIKRELLVPLPYQQPGELRFEAQSLLESHGGAWVIARGRHAAEFRNVRSAAEWRPGGHSRTFGNVSVIRLLAAPAKE